MYTHLSSPIIAFHGCDQKVKDNLLKGVPPKPSLNRYDWLGSGFYCWEQNENRAREFAEEAMCRKYLSKGSVHKPAVIGVIIDYGQCLNLLDSKYLKMVKETYFYVSQTYKNEGIPIPTNRGDSPDFPVRELDCFIIEKIHSIRKESSYPPFDTVRGMFPEGEPLYDGAAFKDKNHIQICIRNLDNIKAFFDPREKFGGDPFAWLNK